MLNLNTHIHLDSIVDYQTFDFWNASTETKIHLRVVLKIIVFIYIYIYTYILCFIKTDERLHNFDKYQLEFVYTYDIY